MRRRLLRLLGALIFFGIFYLLFWPVSIDPVAWTPPEAPKLVGPYALNNKLAAATPFGAGIGVGPEDLAFDAKGWVYTGFEDGRIVAIAPDGKSHKVVANTGGRPLGMAFDADGALIVADAVKGLLHVAHDGKITVLASEAESVAFGFTNNLAIARDGMIYFTDSSTRWGAGHAVNDIFEHQPTGRLMAYDPKTKTVRVLMRKLQYANGVALAADESFLLVVETGLYRIRRYWLKGPKEGQSDMFIENLPGFPDNVTSNGKGTFWLALFTVRNPAADALAGKPFLRKVVWRLPDFLQPGPKPYGFVLGLDESGKVTHNLQDPAGGFSPVTSVVEHDGMLWLGSLSAPSLARIRAP
jgi:sugar lactone lactonase YvrE